MVGRVSYFAEKGIVSILSEESKCRLSWLGTPLRRNFPYRFRPGLELNPGLRRGSTARYTTAPPAQPLPTNGVYYHRELDVSTTPPKRAGTERTEKTRTDGRIPQYGPLDCSVLYIQTHVVGSTISPTGPELCCTSDHCDWEVRPWLVCHSYCTMICTG